MQIYEAEGERGDGRAKLTYKKDEKGNVVMLLNTTVSFLAMDKDKGLVLAAVGEAEDKNYSVLSLDEFVNTTSLLKLIRPYSYYGTARDLEFLVNFWRINSKGYNLVYLKDHQGRYKDEFIEMWVLGEEIRLKLNSKKEEEGLNWKVEKYDTTFDFLLFEKYWYYVDNRERAADYSLLTVRSTFDVIPDEDVDKTRMLFDKWLKQYGDRTLLQALLGWFYAVMYMEEVIECRGLSAFPFFALSGLTQTGKTSLIINLMRFWGMEAAPEDYTQTSPFVETQTLTTIHNVPIWRDEYRSGVGHSPAKEPILRSLYTRSYLKKGTASQQVIRYKPGSTLLLSGEDITIDAATRRRFVYFLLTDKYKLLPDEWDRAVEESDIYSWQLFDLGIKRGFNKTTYRRLMTENTLNSKNSDAEEKICYAALGAVLGFEYGKKAMEDARLYWSEAHANNEFTMLERKSLIETFFDWTHNYMEAEGWYKNKKIYDQIIPAKCLDYFCIVKSEVRIKVGAFVEEMIRKGFKYETTINKHAIMSEIRSKLMCSSVMSRFVDGKTHRTNSTTFALLEKYSGDVLKQIVQAQADYKNLLTINNGFGETINIPAPWEID